ncbi:MAG: histidinol-phosphatase HisJ family protein [Coriobacteriales bacterium]|jgi:histidinol-phosphatase (PHP family)|nr:histidinol-phosphatase HisJ family protein [Coriobacteriales bacterium]
MVRNMELNMEMTDTHTHTWYSGHGDGTVAEVVAVAVARGLTTVALTEHLPLPPEVDPTGTFAMTEDQVAPYLEEIERARKEYPGIEIICGIEVDWREGAEGYILERLGPYELVLGSVHMLSDAAGNVWEFDHPAYIDGWQERGEEQVWSEYLRLWSDAVRSAVPFDVMTHPDLPKKLGFKPRFDPREMYATMAEVAASKDVLIEANTSGLYKPVAELYPGPALLRAFREAGVGCTVSSDAHTPGDVARSLDAAHAAMRAAGYTHVTVPTRTGDRRLIALEELGGTRTV